MSSLRVLLIWQQTCTLPVTVTKSTFCLLPLDRFLLPLTTLNEHPKGVVDISFYHFLECIYCQSWGVPGNSFWNSVNPVKSFGKNSIVLVFIAFLIKPKHFAPPEVFTHYGYISTKKLLYPLNYSAKPNNWLFEPIWKLPSMALWMCFEIQYVSSLKKKEEIKCQTGFIRISLSIRKCFSKVSLWEFELQFPSFIKPLSLGQS